MTRVWLGAAPRKSDSVVTLLRQLKEHFMPQHAILVRKTITNLPSQMLNASTTNIKQSTQSKPTYQPVCTIVK